MAHNPDIHHRKSNRLPRYDYSQGGAYFITICAHERQCLFGELVDCTMVMNDIGRIVAAEWVKTGEMRANVELDEWVVMPNHFHAIVVINNNMESSRRGDLRSPLLRVPSGAHYICCQQTYNQQQGDRQVAPTGALPQSIGAIMAGFKSAVTKQVNRVRHTPQLPVWQRNYWDHIIRDESDLLRIREYVQTNLQRWDLDSLNGELP